MIKSSALYRLTCFYCLLVVAVTDSLAREVDIEEVDVTVSRFNDRVVETPFNVEIITAEEIANNASATLPSLLSSISGIPVTKNYYGNGTNSAALDIRGFGATSDDNTLILLDGRRVKNIDSAAVDWSLIPLSAVERIEIVKGGGAVLYGGGSTAGYINIVTKSPSLVEDRHDIVFTGGSFGTRGLDLRSSFSTDDGGISLFAQRYNSDNYRENNEERRSVAHLDYRKNIGSGTVGFKFGGSREDTRLPGDLNINPASNINQTVPERRRSTETGDYSALDSNYATLTADYLLGDFELLSELGYRDRHSLGALDQQWSTGIIVADTEAFSLTPRLRYVGPINGLANELIFGVDYYDWDLYSTQTTSSTATTLSRLTDYNQENIGFYLSDQISLTDSLTLSAGLRSERQKIVVDDSSLGGSAQVLNLDASDIGLSYRSSSSTEIEINTSKSYRTSNIDDLDRAGQSSITFLRPQVSYTHQVGLKTEVSSTKLSFSLFQIDTEDEIRLDNLTSGVGNTNYPRTKRRGLEIKSNWAGRYVSLKANYSYTQAKFSTGFLTGGAYGLYLSNVDLTQKTIPLVSRHKFNLVGGLNLGDGFRIDATSSYFSSQFLDNDESNSFVTNIPSYYLLDVKATKTFGRFELTAAVNNLLDREYFTYGVRSQTVGSQSYNVYPMPTRSAYVTLKCTF
jgi:iron complex outermembrane receptor protein